MDENTYKTVSRFIASNRIEAAISELEKVNLPADLKKQFTLISNRWYLVQSKRQKGLLVGGRADKAQLAVSASLIDFLYFAHAMEQSLIKEKRRSSLKSSLLRIAFSVFTILTIGSLLAANTWFTHNRPAQQPSTMNTVLGFLPDSIPTAAQDSVPEKEKEVVEKVNQPKETAKSATTKNATVPSTAKSNPIPKKKAENNPKTIHADPVHRAPQSIINADSMASKVIPPLPTVEAVPEKEYYRSIKGTNYDRKILEEAERLTKGSGDGRISKADSKILLEYFSDQQVITDSEKRTLTYIQQEYKWTDAAKKWFNDEYNSLNQIP